MKQKKIDKVACVGAGLIGQGWATFFSVKGLQVYLHDIRQKSLIDAVRRIESNVYFLAEKGLIRRKQIEAALRRIKTTTNLTEAVKDVYYVQESVFEEYDVKKNVFKEMDAAASAETILASSSSGLLMTEIQKVTKIPERCLIVHPFTPPYLVPLVELVPGQKTSSETIESTRSFMIEIGKVPVVLKKEVPGYLANRLAAALWREAIDLVDRGVASLEDVDNALSLSYGFRWAVVGPLFNWHLTGGRGGIEYYLDHIVPAFTSWWKSMNAWTSISDSAKKKLIEGIKRNEEVRNKTYDELIRRRDEKLIELLKVLNA